MSWRKCPAASDGALHVIEQNALATLNRTCNSDECAHRGQAIVNGRALLRFSVQNCVGESFDLPLVTVRVFAQWTMELPIFRREALDMARLVKPGQIDVPLHAARFAVN